MNDGNPNEVRHGTKLQEGVHRKTLVGYYNYGSWDEKRSLVLCEENAWNYRVARLLLTLRTTIWKIGWKPTRSRLTLAIHRKWAWHVAAQIYNFYIKIIHIHTSSKWLYRLFQTYSRFQRKTKNFVCNLFFIKCVYKISIFSCLRNVSNRPTKIDCATTELFISILSRDFPFPVGTKPGRN